MNLGFLKKVPKFTLVAGVLIVSTTLFFLWWHFFHNASHNSAPMAQSAPAVENKRPVADFASQHHFFMAGDDLYDAEAGQLVAKNFLNGAQPDRLYYEPESKKVIGIFANGLVRYSLDGSKELEIAKKSKIACIADSKKLVYVQDNDIWTADVDLQAFKFVNEHKVTSLGQFDEFNFLDNMVLLTDDRLAVKNMNEVVRVELETGRVKPLPADLRNVGKRRSPDSKTVVGLVEHQFYAYNFETDTMQTHSVGRAVMNDCQWIDSDRCVLIVNGRSISVYDRTRDKMNELCSLPFFANQILQPSPSARYVFCGTSGSVGVVDVGAQRFITLPNDVQGYYWLTGDTLLFSREMQDTDRRGTWIRQVANVSETRIAEDPYMIVNNLPCVLPIRDAGLVVFFTRTGLQKMKLDGSGLQTVAVSAPTARLLPIEWRGKQ